jgi:hypothetical protein
LERTFARKQVQSTRALRYASYAPALGVSLVSLVVASERAVAGLERAVDADAGLISFQGVARAGLTLQTQAASRSVLSVLA